MKHSEKYSIAGYWLIIIGAACLLISALYTNK